MYVYVCVCLQIHKVLGCIQFEEEIGGREDLGNAEGKKGRRKHDIILS